MVTIRSAEHGEQLLVDGRLPCPGCGTRLSARGYGRVRTVRGPGAAHITVRPRRARCRTCRATHVLLPAGLVARRADTTEVIGTALSAHVLGAGARRIAAQVGRPISTVRRWLRGTKAGHDDWLYQQGVQAAVRIAPDLLVRPAPQPTRLGAALNLLAGAGLAYRDYLELSEPPWTLIGMLAGGRLLPVLRT